MLQFKCLACWPPHSSDWLTCCSNLCPLIKFYFHVVPFPRVFGSDRNPSSQTKFTQSKVCLKGPFWPVFDTLKDSVRLQWTCRTMKSTEQNKTRVRNCNECWAQTFLYSHIVRPRFCSRVYFHTNCFLGEMWAMNPFMFICIIFT